jgi:hypothetical protein
VRAEQYPTFLAVTRVIDKLFRVATKKDAFGESPWRDIAGYALLGIAADEKEAPPQVSKSFEIESCLQEYARERGIPYEIPEDDDFPLAGEPRYRFITPTVASAPIRPAVPPTGGAADEDPRSVKILGHRTRWR